VREWDVLADSALKATLQIFAIVIAYLVLRAVLYRLSDGILGGILAREHRLGVSDERTGRLQTLRGLSKSLIGYVLFFVFGILLFKAIGFDIMPFITTAGVIGLAIGFGAQKLVKDVISGFFIIIDNVYVVGDTVTIGTVTGQVIEMGMRVTKIHDATGKIYILANGDIGMVTNLSRHPVEDFIEVTVAPVADLGKVYETINTTGKNLFALADTHHLKAAPHILGISAFNATVVTLRIGVTSDPRDLPAEQMRVRAAVRDALLTAQIPLA
jgi:small-conductance mechanosensitive channel